MAVQVILHIKCHKFNFLFAARKIKTFEGAKKNATFCSGVNTLCGNQNTSS